MIRQVIRVRVYQRRQFRITPVLVAVVIIISNILI